MQYVGHDPAFPRSILLFRQTGEESGPAEKRVEEVLDSSESVI
jgi:hypothetical protein